MLPNSWFDVKNQLRADIGEHAWSNAQILQHLEEQLRDKTWQKAAKHYLGAGLEKGTPLLKPYRVVRRQLLKEGLREQAAALDAVVCAGVAPRERFKSSMGEMCPHCGEMPETAFHKFYGCRTIEQLIGEPGSEILEKTRWMKRVAEQNWDKHACLWGRALVPKDLWHIEFADQSRSEARLEAGNFAQNLERAKGVAWSDGSGGPRATPACAAKVGTGCATATFLQHRAGVKDVALICAPVPGAQTVPRAVIQGGEILTSFAACRKAGIDAKYVVDGADAKNEALQGLVKKANGDLWAKLAARRSEAAIEKVKGHTLYIDVLAGATPWEDYIGNALSDVAAGIAAEKAQLPSAVLSEISDTIGKVCQIARRLSYIEARRRGAQPLWVEDVPPPEPPPTVAKSRIKKEVAQRFQQTGHKLRKRRGDKATWLVCGNCRKRRRFEAGSKPWQFQCPAAGSAAELATEHAQQRRTNDFDDPEAGLEEELAEEEAFPEPEPWQPPVRLVSKAVRERHRQQQARGRRRTMQNQQRQRETTFLELCDAGFFAATANGQRSSTTPAAEAANRAGTHRSHRRIIVVGGFLACRGCGRYKGRERHSPTLSQPCPGKICKGGGAPLAALLRGRLPPKARAWPEDW